MTTIPRFLALTERVGSPIVLHREYKGDLIFPQDDTYPDDDVFPDSGGVCPCVTPEGFRDPVWHRTHPLASVCNEIGLLDPYVLEVRFKGWMQPIQSTRATRLNTEYLQQLFGEVRADDHLGILPMTWRGEKIDLTNWSDAGDDYLLYNGRRFTIVNLNVIADPSDGFPEHHQEIGARLMGAERVAA